MRKTLISCLVAVSAVVNAEICIKDGDAIAFMGDSITYGGNATPAGYVNLVMKGLEICGIKAKKIPAGIGGHKSVQMHARLKRDVLDKKPEWMTFSCGVNDVWHGKNGVPLDRYKILVGEIFDRCAAAGVEVIVLTATMICEDADNRNNRLLAGYNDWLRAEAKRRGLRLADLNADMQAQLAEIRSRDKTPGNKLTRDGVHMAFAGDCMMAWGILKAMGVADSKKDEIFAAFRRQPGAAKINLLLSADEAEELDRHVKGLNTNREKYILEKLGIKR